MIQNKLLLISALLFLIFLNSCIDDPHQAIENFTAGNTGALVLCEGLYGTDNSTITCINLEDGSSTDTYFRTANYGQKLGDIANDMEIIDSIVYVSVSNSGTIEAFELKTGKSIGRIKFPPNVMPRELVIISDSLAYVSTYISMSENDFFVYEFNPKKLELTGVKIQVGSHPEGMTAYKNKLYVVNSGYGDFHSHHSKASTISVIDLSTKTEIDCIKTENNPNRIYATKDGKIYVVYWELPSLKDSASGGILEYDAENMKVLRNWKTTAYDLCLNENCDTIFYLNSSLGASSDGNTSKGVNYIALNEEKPQVQQFIENTKDNEIWTALSLNKQRNEIWVTNSYRYTSAGELMIYDLTSKAIKQRYRTGIIPNQIKFYSLLK